MASATSQPRSIMLLSLERKFDRHEKLRKRIHVANSADVRALLERECAAKVCGQNDIDRVTDALTSFVAGLYATPYIEAIAVLAVRAPQSPVSFSLEVIGPFERRNSHSAGAVRAAIEADGLLTRRLMNIIPSGLRFVSTVGLEPDDLRNQLLDRWVGDRDQSLLTLIVFRRD